MKDVTIIRMPLLSDTMEAGKIVKWNKKIGDKVKSDDAIADVETDKATMEVVGYADGVLLHTAVKEGESVKVNGVIAIVGKQGTDIKGILKEIEQEESATSSPVATKEELPVATPTSTVASTTNTNLNDGRIKASPLAKQVAKASNINLSNIKGSGDNGRIIIRDLKNISTLSDVVKSNVVVDIPVFPSSGYEEIEISSMRKVIAKRLTESKINAPHCYLTVKVNMDNAIKGRTRLNELGKVKISFNDMILKASAMALKKHPNVNSSWRGDKIRINYDVNIGVAVSIPDGLLVPVVRNADQKSLTIISQEVKTLANKSKDKTLKPTEWEGSTFTISNLGMFGIDEFMAIINTPDACILAISSIKEEPVVKNGQIVIGNTMNLTLSADHRVVDGVAGAVFLQTLKNYLEEPFSMLL